MPKRKKSKSNRNKRSTKIKAEKDPKILNNVERTFCELTIADIQKKISTLINFVETLKRNDKIIQGNISQLNTGGSEIPENLRAEIKVVKRTIENHKSELCELNSKLNIYLSEGSQKLKETETKYKEMYLQRLCERKQLQGRLNSLRDFRETSSFLYKLLDDMAQEQGRKDDEYDKQMWQIEERGKIQRHQIRDAAWERLMDTLRQFYDTYMSRNKGFAQRLLRGNTILDWRTEMLYYIERCTKSKIKVEKNRIWKFRRENKDLKRQMRRLLKCQSYKMEIINKLSRNFENLYNEHESELKYIQLYKQVREKLEAREGCDRFFWAESQKNFCSLRQYKDEIKLFVNRLLVVHEAHEKQEIHLHRVLKQVRATVLEEIQKFDQNITNLKVANTKKTRNVYNCVDDPLQPQVSATISSSSSTVHDFLTQLLILVSNPPSKLSNSLSIPTIASSNIPLYSPGSFGPLPQTSASMMDIFKPNILANEKLIKEKTSRILVAKKDPFILSSCSNEIHDPVTDTTLIVSSLHGLTDMPVIMKLPDDDSNDVQEDKGVDSESSSETCTTNTIHRTNTSTIELQSRDKYVDKKFLMGRNVGGEELYCKQEKHSSFPNIQHKLIFDPIEKQ